MDQPDADRAPLDGRHVLLRPITTADYEHLWVATTRPAWQRQRNISLRLERGRS